MLLRKFFSDYSEYTYFEKGVPKSDRFWERIKRYDKKLGSLER